VIVLAAESVAEQLLTLAAQGFGVAVGVILAFSLALSATIRVTDARRAGHRAAVLPWTVVALVAYAAFGLMVVLALFVVVDK
jgi:hypothetical protein